MDDPETSEVLDCSDIPHEISNARPTVTAGSSHNSPYALPNISTPVKSTVTTSLSSFSQLLLDSFVCPGLLLVLVHLLK